MERDEPAASQSFILPEMACPSYGEVLLLVLRQRAHLSTDPFSKCPVAPLVADDPRPFTTCAASNDSLLLSIDAFIGAVIGGWCSFSIPTAEAAECSADEMDWPMRLTMLLILPKFVS